MERKCMAGGAREGDAISALDQSISKARKYNPEVISKAITDKLNKFKQLGLSCRLERFYETIKQRDLARPSASEG